MVGDKQKNYNYETGHQISTKFGVGVTESLLLSNGGCFGKWFLSCDFEKKITVLPHAEPSDHFIS